MTSATHQSKATPAGPKTEPTKTKTSSAPKKTKPSLARRDENDSLSKRAYDDHGFCPWDLVTADDQETQFIVQDNAIYGPPGSYLWTRGLATCVGIAVYGRPAGDPYTGGKILAHVSGGQYHGMLNNIDHLIWKN